jgi:protein-L-isoaspartate(D-aspartate) O-methyltransferase
MVEKQLRTRGIQDPRVLAAMEEVPRHEFVPAHLRHLSYSDEPVILPCQQTISQPYMVAAMAEALKLTGKERVLEVGAGSGYAAAVMAQLSDHVYAIECEHDLVVLARANLTRTGFADRVTVIEGDGTFGYQGQAPYDAISVAAAARRVPQPLIEQLNADGGRLVIPVGPEYQQELRLIRRFDGQTESKTITHCRFVPLRGAHLEPLS